MVPRLVQVHARLFPDDVAELKRLASVSGLTLQIELRLLVHRALRGERRELVVLKDQL